MAIDLGYERVKVFVNSIKDDLNRFNCCGSGKLGELNDIQRIIDHLLFDDSGTLSFAEELQKKLKAIIEEMRMILDKYFWVSKNLQSHWVGYGLFFGARKSDLTDFILSF